MAKEKKKDKKTSLSIEGMAPVFKWAGALTKLQRILIFVVTFAVIGGGYWFLFYQPKHEALEKAKKEYAEKQQKLKRYKVTAAQLPKFEKKLEAVRETLNLAITALPDKKELPSLITGISRAGSDSGLEFLLFQPKPEVKKEFYAEIPVQMDVTGGFHQIANFFDKVSRLYRIVNVENVKIKRNKNSSDLRTSCVAVTYMFVKEAKQNNKKKKR